MLKPLRAGSVRMPAKPVADLAEHHAVNQHGTKWSSRRRFLEGLSSFCSGRCNEEPSEPSCATKSIASFATLSLA
jgi:hypothetical protein